jgi:hypothetical protein
LVLVIVGVSMFVVLLLWASAQRFAVRGRGCAASFSSISVD